MLSLAGLKLPNDSGIVQSQSILEPTCCCQPSNLHTLAKTITISSWRDFSKCPSLNLALLVALRTWRSTAGMIGCRIGVYVFDPTLTNRGPVRLRLITRQGILVARLALSYHKDLSLLVNFGTIHFVFVLLVWSNMYCLSSYCTTCYRQIFIMNFSVPLGKSQCWLLVLIKESRTRSFIVHVTFLKCWIVDFWRRNLYWFLLLSTNIEESETILTFILKIQSFRSKRSLISGAIITK